MQIINSLIKMTKIGLLILLFGFYFKPCYFKIVIVFYETLFFAICCVFIVFSKHYLWPNTKFNRVVGLISIKKGLTHLYQTISFNLGWDTNFNTKLAPLLFLAPLMKILAPLVFGVIFREFNFFLIYFPKHLLLTNYLFH